MTVKPKMKKETNKSEPSEAVETVSSTYTSVSINDLLPSATNPRRRINDESIASLAESIKLQGILEPIIVRKLEDKFEIVCGERRYRAALVARLSEVPCIIRVLTDDEVLNIQIHENLHREDIHPMDEAFGFKILQERLGCNSKELAIRVGKTEGYVLNRLKLNQLIAEAQQDIDDEHLPLSYALEIAKYPEDIQRLILAEVYRTENSFQDERWIRVPIKGDLVSMKWLLEWINTNVHRILSKAPFNTMAENLRPDGLACAKCPERTGAVIGLFEPEQVGKKDACLNPACYAQKVENHITVRRSELAGLRNVDPADVPIVRSWSYSDGEGYLGSRSAIVIGDVRGGSSDACDNAVSGIDIERDNYGETVGVCLRSTGCLIHWPDQDEASNEGSLDQPSEEQVSAARLDAHRSRREEIWNARVAEAVRIRIFKAAAEKFAKKFRISETHADFLAQMIARFWRMTSSGDANNLQGIIKPLIMEWEPVSSEHSGVYSYDIKTAIEQHRKLDRSLNYRILFLLTHCYKGTVGYNNGYSSQSDVRQLAAEFEIDYDLFDAEVRLELCGKKYHDVHSAYYDAVREKLPEAKVPRLYSDSWAGRD